MSRTYVLGVDAGGTKSTAALADTGGNVIARHSAGPGNPHRIGSEDAFRNVIHAIDHVVKSAEVNVTDIKAAVLGMAGAGTKAIQSEATMFVRMRTNIEQLSVIPDFELVLPAAFPDGGIALVAGTGSVAHGVRGERETRVGGHGYVAGDEGSGYWIGQQALRSIAYALDGRGPQTALTNLVCDANSVSDPTRLMPTIHASPDPLNRVAAIAPLVVQAAGEDKTAGMILDSAARELCQMISVARTNVGYDDGYSLAIAGSVLTKTSAVRDRLEFTLKTTDCVPKIITTVFEPVYGAVAMAIRLLG